VKESGKVGHDYIPLRWGNAAVQIVLLDCGKYLISANLI